MEVIHGVDHVALSVSNLERSIRFYQLVGGLEVQRVIEKSPGEKLGRVTGLPGARARIAHLSDGRIMLELFEYVSPSGRAIEPGRTQADYGFIHIGFRSDDTRADYRRLLEAGVSFIGEPTEFRPGVWICYFCGPDGEVCELRQPD